LNDAASSHRLAQAQSEQAQLAPQSHVAAQVQVGVQEQGETHAQPLAFVLALFASLLMVFMRHLVFGLNGLYEYLTGGS
jgi:predicted TPR repeat methyltransferase